MKMKKLLATGLAVATALSAMSFTAMAEEQVTIKVFSNNPDRTSRTELLTRVL